MTVKATEADIATFRAACPPNIPESFIDFHQRHGALQRDIENSGHGFVFLWNLNEVLTFSREYGFDEFVPGLLGIGSDGGGGLYALDLRGGPDCPVGVFDAICLEYEHFLVIDRSFPDFAERLLRGVPYFG